MRHLLILCFLSTFLSPHLNAQEGTDYTLYHQKVIQAEVLIVAEKYQEAFSIYEGLFQAYNFIFLREYQVASQLAVQLENKEKALELIEQGILGGWSLKSIKKNTCLASLWSKPHWKAFKKEYPIRRAQYEARLDRDLQAQLKKMFSEDQKKAIRALLRIGSRAQDRYAERKFAPHSIEQMAKLKAILEKYIYPGERLIGPNYWTSTILSHHNSISQQYNQKDLLYPKIKPMLQKALRMGYLAPAEWALIDEWHRIVTQEKDQAHYGLIKEPTAAGELAYMNELRASMCLRSIDTRNQLLNLEQKTGMDFYLPKGWIDGQILIKQ